MAVFMHLSRQIVRQLPCNIGSTAKPTCIISVRTNCHRASITRAKRKDYTRTYPVQLVLSDGSSFTIRYNTPRRLLIMPEDLNKLTPEEKFIRYRRMDPPKRVKVEEYVADEFDTTSRFKYLDQIKKK